jgi:hypothetical protein
MILKLKMLSFTEIKLLIRGNEWNNYSLFSYEANRDEIIKQRCITGIRIF